MIPRAYWTAALTLGIGVLGLGIWNATLFRQLQAERGQMAEMRGRVNARFQVLLMLTSPGVVKRTLAATALVPRGEVRLVLEPGENAAAVIAANLPALTADDIYQVWLGHPGARFQAARFEVDDGGSAEAILSVPHRLTACETGWITIEPARGDPLPNGPGVARGALWDG